MGNRRDSSCLKDAVIVHDKHFCYGSALKMMEDFIRMYG